MNLLLDTHLLIWVASTPERLSSEALSWLQNPEHKLYFSAVNLWEISIKRGLGRKDFHVEPSLLRRGLIENGYTELAITSVHCIALEQLPAIRKDPFNRMLVAQAVSEGMLLLTSDSVVANYFGLIELL